ncbi:MAG: HNH endonuclease [Caldilineaceae bacterium]|nr:HNH endonuclease [Caldilineaceae bacterium]
MPPNRPYIPTQIRQQVEQEAQMRCGYCRTSHIFTAKTLHIEHIIPIAAGGGSEIDNLWLACELCNGAKGMKTHAVDPLTIATVALFHPRLQQWSDHFRWSEDGTRILGITPNGRATVAALKLNRPSLVAARKWWVSAGWHPPLE